jgi:hypothetical protein
VVACADLITRPPPTQDTVAPATAAIEKLEAAEKLKEKAFKKEFADGAEMMDMLLQLFKMRFRKGGKGGGAAAPREYTSPGPGGDPWAVSARLYRV